MGRSEHHRRITFLPRKKQTRRMNQNFNKNLCMPSYLIPRDKHALLYICIYIYTDILSAKETCFRHGSQLLPPRVGKKTHVWKKICFVAKHIQFLPMEPFLIARGTLLVCQSNLFCLPIDLPIFADPSVFVCRPGGFCLRPVIDIFALRPQLLANRPSF